MAPTGTTNRMPRPLATPPLANSIRLMATASTMAWTKVVARKLGSSRRPPTTIATPAAKYTTQVQRNSSGRALPTVAFAPEIGIERVERGRHQQPVEIHQPDDAPGEIGRCERYGGD